MHGCDEKGIHIFSLNSKKIPARFFGVGWGGGSTIHSSGACGSMELAHAWYTCTNLIKIKSLDPLP
jgi:hypothetical protein